MKAVLTGADGQLGMELRRTKPNGVKLYPFDLPELDIRDKNLVMEKIGEIKPDLVINAAAYTDVESAEEEREKAFDVNCKGVINLAEAVKETNSFLIHISTDFIFDGKTYSPYKTNDKPSPVSVYGETKLQGENALKSILDDYLIIRTAWTYSVFGNNFVKKMISLMEERERLNVVDDEFGTPTWAYNLAQFIWKGASQGLKGCYHFTDEGSASRYDFACAISREAFDHGLISKKPLIFPVCRNGYKTKAKRPLFCILDKSDTRPFLKDRNFHWRESLTGMIKEYKSRLKAN